MIACLDTGNSGADFLDYRAALMAEYCRENTFRIFAGECKCIGMAYTCGDISQQDLTVMRPLDIDFFYFKSLARFPGDSSTCFHFVRFLWQFLLSGRIFARMRLRR
jgi:hypothetical protein